MKRILSALMFIAFGFSGCGGSEADAPVDPIIPPQPIQEASAIKLELLSSSVPLSAKTEGLTPVIVTLRCSPKPNTTFTLSGDFIGGSRIINCPADGIMRINDLRLNPGPNGQRVIRIVQETSSGEILSSLEWNYNLSKCPGLGGLAVRSDYSPDDQGEFCSVRNRLDAQGPQFNFQVPNMSRRLLADPSIVQIADTFYVTGTSDNHGTGNIPIYRSTNLIDWQFYKFAYPSDGDDSDAVLLINGRRLCHIWDAALAVDPGDPNALYITYTATEDRGNGVCSSAAPWNDQTVFSDSTSLVSFTTTSTHYFSNPQWPYYTINNESPGFYRYDGGVAVAKRVATAVHRGVQNATPVGDRLAHRWPDGAIEHSTALGLGATLFFDPNANNKPWMIYDFVIGVAPNYGNYGAMSPLVAAPGRRHVAFDANRAEAEYRFMGHRQNSNYSVGGVPEGCYGRDGPMIGVCVTEGRHIFYYNGRYYLTMNYNAWDSAAYATYYRVSNTLEGLSLPGGWNATTNPPAPIERLLISSQNRTAVNGAHFAGGQLFSAFGKLYAIFHAKDAGSAMRTPYFKEVTVNADGSLMPLTNSGTNDATDINVFLVPRPAS